MNKFKLYSENTTNLPVNLTLSVNPLGCSLLSLRALKKVTQKDISLYPENRVYLNKIAKYYNVNEDQILAVNGSELAIKLIINTFLKKSESCGIARGSFGLFTKEAKLNKSKIHYFNDNKLKKLIDKVTFIANPKTPTGEFVDISNFNKQLKNSDKNKILVIDEANGEFATDSAIKLVNKFENLLVLKTTSKVFGLAGIRLGFIIGNKNLINQLKFVLQPFPVSTVSLIIFIESLKDKGFINRTILYIKKQREKIVKELDKLGINSSNSITNNLFIYFQNEDLIIKKLNNAGVAVISGAYFPKNDSKGFRISIKDEKTNKKFIDILKKVIKNIRSNNI